VEAVITDMVRPNGLAFSPDESLLYVADTGRTHGPENPAHIRVFEVDGQNRLSGGNVSPIARSASSMAFVSILTAASGRVRAMGSTVITGTAR
jgi:DNA-binding beta-propeller fold protein YncE